jgi:hypothetical protein
MKSHPAGEVLTGWLIFQETRGRFSVSLFLENEKFHVIERDFLVKAVLVEANLFVTLKVPDGGFEPHGLAQVEDQAQLLQALKDFVGAGVVRIDGHDRILLKMIIFPEFSP